MPPTIFDQAVGLHESGQLDSAKSLYQHLLSQDVHPILSANIGSLYESQNQPQEALHHYLEAINRLPFVPSEIELLRKCVDLSSRLGDMKLAEDCLRRLLELKPNDPKELERFAGVLLLQDGEEEALAILESIQHEHGSTANLWNLKGLAMCRLGKIEQGVNCFKEALELDNGLIAAFGSLMQYGLKTHRELISKYVPFYQAHIETEESPLSIRMNIAYILCRYYEECEPRIFFQYLKFANDSKRKSYQYSVEQDRNKFELIKRILNKGSLDEYSELINPASRGKAIPIFILGMPRSGSTLIEQILSSHSAITAKGELTELNGNFDACLQSVSEADGLSKELAKQFRQVLEYYIGSAGKEVTTKYFTDKMPANFMSIGLILKAMPEAIVIHSKRSPLETCFSIYKQNFLALHPYSNSLSELGQYYKLYEDLMSFWEQQFPGRIIHVEYEELVADSELGITQILSQCGLEAEEACFKFYEKQGVVRTASNVQVRKPIYKDALSASAPFKEELRELEEVLLL